MGRRAYYVSWVDAVAHRHYCSAFCMNPMNLASIPPVSILYVKQTLNQICLVTGLMTVLRGGGKVQHQTPLVFLCVPGSVSLNPSKITTGDFPSP